jgi:hypothetical protein
MDISVYSDIHMYIGYYASVKWDIVEGFPLMLFA